jgi:hypothetical protein
MPRQIKMTCEENCNPCMLEMKNVPDHWSCKRLAGIKSEAKEEGESIDTCQRVVRTLWKFHSVVQGDLVNFNLALEDLRSDGTLNNDQEKRVKDRIDGIFEWMYKPGWDKSFLERRKDSDY